MYVLTSRGCRNCSIKKSYLVAGGVIGCERIHENTGFIKGKISTSKSYNYTG